MATETAMKKPFETLYPLEWEEKAFKEVLLNFNKIWDDVNYYNKLLQENKEIKLGPCLPECKAEGPDSEELVALHRRILKDFICHEPVLCRVLAYTAIEPEDTQARQEFFKKHLHAVNFLPYVDILSIDVLTGSDLAKSRDVSGIPLHSCFVGKVLKTLLDEAESRWMTDNGNPEEIRITRTAKGLDFEYFNKADYDSPLVDRQIDDILCAMFHKAQGDRRQDLFFGNGIDHREYQIVKRFGEKEKEPIPFHLLPKWSKFIKGESFKRDIRFEDAIRYFSEIIPKWDKSRGPATNYLQAYLKFKLRDEFKKIVKENKESMFNISSDTVCDDDIITKTDRDYDEMVGYIIEKGLKNEKLMAIYEKQNQGIALSATERQNKKRIEDRLEREYSELKKRHTITEP